MIERRTILTGAGAALTTSLFTGRVKGANDRVAIGHIGIGAMGSGNLGYALRMPDVQPVAVCDVYQPTLDKAVATAAKGGSTVKAVKDFREILADKSIDAVCISTPDHWHAYMTVEACKAGKDVFVEKPASVYVEEGHKMPTFAPGGRSQLTEVFEGDGRKQFEALWHYLMAGEKITPPDE